MKKLGLLSIYIVLIAVLTAPFTVLAAAPSSAHNVTLGSNFNSTFNTTAAGWARITGPWSLVSSAYYSTYGASFVWSSIAHDGVYKDMTYEAKMRRIGCMGCSNVLYIRGNPALFGSYNNWRSSYEFIYAGDGYFSVFRSINGTAYPLKAWTISSAVHAGANWNDLKVVATGTLFKFYINGILVWTGSNSAFSTGRVGIGMFRDNSLGNRLYIDSAKLTKITTVLSATDDEVVAPGTEVPGGTEYQAP
jgi:hypothetical protein